MDFNVGTIEREYELKRSNVLKENDSYIKSVYNDLPQMAEIDAKIRQLGVEASKISITNDEDKQTKIAAIFEKMDELKAQKESILKEKGISLEPKFECPKCKDTGYITVNMQSQMCSCMKQRLLDYYYNKHNLLNLKLENWSNFNESYYSDEVDQEKYNSKISPKENIKKIKKLAKEFIENFDNPDCKSLLFTGTAGTGKTFISGCIANDILEKGHTVLYETAPLLLDNIFEYKYGSKSKMSKELYDSLFDVDLLIIDDLGTENQSDAKFTELFNIINSRIINPKTKTIISTNFGLKQLSKLYDDRIVSRLIGEYTICRFFGNDIRLSQNKK